MRPSGSSLKRGWECPASFALNQAPNTGEEALKGTDNHEAIEGDLVVGESSKHAVVRELMVGALSVDVEVALALDIEKETVRYLGSRINRRYGELNENEIPLSIDAVIARPNTVIVADWKSRKRVESAARNLQIRAACVAVMKWWKTPLSSVLGVIGYLDNDEADTHTFDSFDIPTFFADMRKMRDRIAAAKLQVAKKEIPDVHSGSWCDYCPALPYCPAHTRMALAMIGDLDNIEQTIAFMTAEQAGKAWPLVKRIQSLADKVEASLKLRAQHEVVPLPNGKRLAMIDTSRSSFNGKKAIAWIKDHGGNPDDFVGRTYFSKVAEINMGKE